MSGSLLADTEAPSRTRTTARVRRRPNLPSGRAVTGGLLVALAALGTYVAVAGDGEVQGDPYVIANRTIDPGPRIAAADLRVVHGHLPPEVAATSFTASEAVEGAVALAPLTPGALIQHPAIRVDPVGGGDLAPEVALRLPRAQAVDGTLVPGEHVDLLATYGSGTDAETHLVARGVLVTSIGRTQDPGLGDDGGVTLTLRLRDEDEVLRTTHAKDVATVTLVRSTGDESSVLRSYRGPAGRDDSLPAAAPEPSP